MDKRAEIASLVTALAEYYDKPISPTQIAAYTEDLLDMDPAELGLSIVAYRNDPRNDRFPLPVKLKAAAGRVSNPEDEAVQIAGRIVGAISKFGPYQSEKARESIGEIGWQVVQMDGGWMAVCETQTDDVPIRRAQWRNLAKSLFEKGTRESLQQIANQAKGTLNLTAFGGVLKSLPKESA